FWSAACHRSDAVSVPDKSSTVGDPLPRHSMYIDRPPPMLTLLAKVLAPEVGWLAAPAPVAPVLTQPETATRPMPSIVTARPIDFDPARVDCPYASVWDSRRPPFCETNPPPALRADLATARTPTTRSQRRIGAATCRTPTRRTGRGQHERSPAVASIRPMGPS